MTYERLIDVAVESGCKSSEMGILVILYRHGGTLPSRDLAKQSNDSLGKVRLACKKLKDMGLVSFRMEHDGMRFKQLIYSISVDENGPLTESEGLKGGDEEVSE